MKYNYTITIRRPDGTEYTCKRPANDEEQAVNMVKVPDGDKIVSVSKDWAHPNY